jgi:hypothetical protein
MRWGRVVTDLAYDSAKAADYLMSRPGFPVLSAAHVDPVTHKKGVFETRSFPHPVDRQAMITWIEERQGKANIYYSLNPVRMPLSTKAERTDIARVESLHIDLDPRAGESQEDAQKRCTAQLEAYRMPPTTFIGSGGGVQGISDLEDGIDIGGDILKAEDAKLYNLQLERELGGDHCHNIDRILRVPYTVNVADTKKLHKGRHDAVATIIKSGGPKYPLSAFMKAAPTKATAKLPKVGTNAVAKARD